MSFGRSNKPGNTTIKLDSPPAVRNVSWTSALGDTYTAKRSNRKESYTSQLSGATQSALNASQQGSADVLRELAQPPQNRADDIRKLADRQFESQANVLERGARALEGDARTRLSRRFGKSSNSTFGQQLLSGLADNHLRQLGNARLNADLLAEDRFDRDERSRLSRLEAFQNVINDVADREARFQTTASGVLGREADRENRNAMLRAQLLNNWNANQDRLQQQRDETLQKAMQAAQLTLMA